LLAIGFDDIMISMEVTMAQLVVRNLPDDVKERLKRRAKRHGRSLEAEVRDVLSQVQEPGAESPQDTSDFVARLIRRQRKIGITDADIDALNGSIEELRREWRLHDIDDARK
jgi:antitoxin FitA